MQPAALTSQPRCILIKEKKCGVGILHEKEEERPGKGLQVVRRACTRAERLKTMFAIRIESSLIQKAGF